MLAMIRSALVRLGATLVALSAAAQSPPGRMVDIGGRSLHLVCVGEGLPAVMLESGGGGFSVEWELVQSRVAGRTRVCAYDRAGYAWSDPGPTIDGIEQIVDDLGEMLRRAEVEPPYVLVGASLGAIYSRAYQRRFPEQVAGLVFVDGTHDEGVSLVRDGEPIPISLLSAEELPAAYRDYRAAAPTPVAGPADAPPLNRLSAESQRARHWALSKLIDEAGRLPSGLAAAESWRREFRALRSERLATEYPLGDLPLIVLERSEGSTEVHRRRQRELAGLSARGRLIRAEGSGHLIHLDRPDLVSQAILDVLAGARNRPESR